MEKEPNRVYKTLCWRDEDESGKTKAIRNHRTELKRGHQYMEGNLETEGTP
jgi:hypothetical protein